MAGCFTLLSQIHCFARYLRLTAIPRLWLPITNPRKSSFFLDAVHNKALLYGDLVKLVGVATSQEEHLQLLQFKKLAESGHETPLITIKMGLKGQLSSIQNGFLTPVSHHKLRFRAGPGQLSADLRKRS